MDVSDVPIHIDNIIIEPKSTSQQFVIYGAYDNSTEDAGGDFSDVKSPDRGEDVMITLDFSGLHEPQCKGADSPGKDGSDFELWSPHDDGRHGSADKCFLGQQVTYVRRKEDSECFNGEDFERTTMRQSCLCTQADYECDVNYHRNTGGVCDPLPDVGLNRVGGQMLAVSGVDKELDCKAEGFYYTSNGYRKIPGNKCYGGVDLDPTQHACSGIALIGSVAGGRNFVLGLVIIAVLYYGWPIVEAILLMLPIPDPKGTLETVKGFAGGAVEMVSSAMTTPSRRNQMPSGYSGSLENAPESYLGGDDDDDDSSDEEIGKNAPGEAKLSLAEDSDDEEKNDDDTVPVSSEPGSSDLLDLAEGSSGNESASTGTKLIPKLAGPK